MFEGSIAFKYLIPRKKRLSTSLISIVSFFVITLVVWLALVFLSVTSGIEKRWLLKLTSLHAPLRISPTNDYFSSYYYQIDRFASSSSFSPKTIGEKRDALKTDPYNREEDPELPQGFPQKASKNLVKELFSVLNELSSKKAFSYEDFEISGALLKLHIKKEPLTTISQMSYLLSTCEKNPNFKALLSTFDKNVKNPVYLPKSMQDSGVHLYDEGVFCYTSSLLQEQKIPFTVAGFYDPGTLPIGNRVLLVPIEMTRQINASHMTFSPDGMPTNGIFLFADLKEIPVLKKMIEEALLQKGLAPYWKVMSYTEFEFSKDLMQQFQSDKALFTLLAVIILFVATSNIISYLIMLVHDKKQEIAILQALGASKKSIAAIFGLSGLIIGLSSSLLGSLAAYFTLKHIDTLVHILNTLQGHPVFHPAFFGATLPNALSLEALIFVVALTPIFSLLAGLIPAIQACRINPSAQLRAQ